MREVPAVVHVLTMGFVVALAAQGCVSTEKPNEEGTGGSPGNGGASSGGRTGTGGSASGTGGTPSASGGSTGAGGAGGSVSGSGGANPGNSGGSAPSAGGGAGGSSAGSGGAAGGDAGASDTAAETGGPATDAGALPKFSFFVTSIESLRMLSGNPKGFGGDFRFGKPDGLSGADEICRRIAEMGMPGAGRKTWRAFLSAVAGPDGKPVNAIDRVGNGPWYDRVGRMVAASKADLATNRPRGAHPAIINDLPNEHGIPNGHPVPGGRRVDNHHMLTGSKGDGTLNSMNKRDTCNDWTTSVGSEGRPRVGVAWPRVAGDHWISWGFEGGCAPGFNLVDGAGPTEGNTAVGSNGGYGGFYCLALEP